MSRSRVMIPFNTDDLKQALRENGWNSARVAEFFGISKQAVSQWFQQERIPPRKIADLAQELALSAGVVEKILDKQESTKDMAREIWRLQEENERLKKAVAALTGNAQL